MTLRLLILILLSVPLALAPGLPQWVLDGNSGQAWADDDDDDDDDDSGSRNDDDDDDDRGPLRPIPAPPRVAPPPTPTPPPPAYAPGEIIASGLSEDDLGELVSRGFTLLSDGTLRRLGVPGGMALEEAREVVRALPSTPTADFNHFYRTDQGFSESCQGIECPARQILDWPQFVARADACGVGIAIGMIDTGINADHETFAGASLGLERLAPEDFDPSQAIHGTAVAALLVGDPASRSPGLVPAAELAAIDVFYRAGSDERADAASLVQALGILSEKGVSVINLSLSGPENALLAQAIDRLIAEDDIVVVSAVGNAGPSAGAAYPAGFDPVIAVTAVDRQMNVYRRAVRGEHVDLAAPGVDVWSAASISGARTHTGTSFAAPFVSAAAALLRHEQPELSAAEVAETLLQWTKDLGEPGRDMVFGAGLLQPESLCAGARDQHMPSQ